MRCIIVRVSQDCFSRLSPGLLGSLERGWAGMVEYWQLRDQMNTDQVHCVEDHPGDPTRHCTWQPCPPPGSQRWFESVGITHNPC